MSLIKSSGTVVSRYNKITIVFDGREEYSFCFNHALGVSSNISVVFSSNESADDKIISLVANAANAKIIILISDDRQLGRSVRSFGAAIMSVNDFLGKCYKQKCAASDDSGRLSPAVEREITEELEKVWLKNNGR